MGRCLVLLALLLLPGPAAGEEPARQVSVALRVRGAAPPAPKKEIEGRATAIWFGPGKVDPVTFPVSTEKAAAVELRPGRWVLQAEAPGYWGEEWRLDLGAGAPATAGTSGTFGTLDLWPAGVLEGSFTQEGKDEAPVTFTVFFRSSPEAAAGPVPAPSQVVCPVAKKTWRCTLPAGLLDLRFQAAGFIPRYLWGVRIGPGTVQHPGALDLRRGSAVLGWLVTADGSRLGDEAEVTLRPRGGAAVRGPEGKRMSALDYHARVNPRGFFQIDGVAPGAYVLEARHPRFAPATASVRVSAGEVTQVADPPLLLEAPKLAEVFVDPPTDPAGEPWTVRLKLLDRDSTLLTAVAESPAALDGSWKKPGLAPGHYLVQVARPGGETWWSDQAEIGPSSGPVQATLDVVEVEGAVHLGKKPLPAKLRFGGRYGAVRVEAVADGDGKFETFLPKAGDWAVHVEADDPAVQREIPKLAVRPKPGTRKARVDLLLPDTRLRGTVVDENGKPIGKAIVTALPHGEVREAQVQARADSDGRFVFHGLLPGPVLVEADAGEDRFAEPVTVDVREDEEDRPILLFARAQIRLRGTVVSAAGPVPGARVKAAPVGMPYIGVRTVASDAQGSFEVTLPSQARELTVSLVTPGFAFRMLRLPVPEDRRLNLGVDQAAGTLTLEREEALDYADPNAPMIFLRRGGASESLTYLLGWATMAGAPAQTALRSVIPGLEPGEYQACWVLPAEEPALDAGVTLPGRCVAGSLPPGGELSLKLPAAPRPARAYNR